MLQNKNIKTVNQPKFKKEKKSIYMYINVFWCSNDNIIWQKILKKDHEVTFNMYKEFYLKEIVTMWPSSSNKTKLVVNSDPILSKSESDQKNRLGIIYDNFETILQKEKKNMFEINMVRHPVQRWFQHAPNRRKQPLIIIEHYSLTCPLQ